MSPGVDLPLVRRGARAGPRAVLALLLGFLAACGEERSAPEPAPVAEAARPAAEPVQPAPAEPAAEESVRPGTNAQFLAPDLDLAHWIGTFEGESREIAVERDAIAAAIGLRPGLAVADIGSGTGLFLGPLSAGVGASGKVFAVELAPGFVEHLRKRVAEEGLANVEVVQCTDRSVELAPDSIDVAFVCDTYHHFEYPQTVLASLRRALRAGGSLVVVDFERIEGVSRDWVFGHVRAGKETTIAEICAAGFGAPEEVEVSGLVENYVLRFPEGP